MKSILGVPWKTSELDDSDKLRLRCSRPNDDFYEKHQAPIRGEGAAPRNLAIQRKVLGQYGYTQNCGGQPIITKLTRTTRTNVESES